MSLKQPESMEEVIYFTRRTLEPKGRVVAWTFKQECSKCKKALMGKPVDKGKVKIRATEYVCPECGYSEDKKEHEDKAEVFVEYTCPFCEHSGETTTPFKRKTWQGRPAYVFICDSCKEKIGITKRMAAP
ncbi:hypothetical protein K9L67_03350, partial [Candidatus Woesearchaeota archaeon]|nr:hypothetical protein [Candidatus Woesearchaeota archaeon]